MNATDTEIKDVNDQLIDKNSEIDLKPESDSPSDETKDDSLEYLNLLEEINLNISDLMEYIEKRDQEELEQQLLENEEPQIMQVLDYSNQLDALITNQETVQENLDTFASGSQILVTYGIFYFPLMVIILSLYWFFKQFRDSY